MKNKIFVVLVSLVLCVIFSKEVFAFGEYDLGGSLNPINVQISQDPYEVQRNANTQKEANLKSSYGTSNYYACYSTYESSCGITADVGNPYTQASCLSSIQYCLESNSLKENFIQSQKSVPKQTGILCNNKYWNACASGKNFVCPASGDAYCETPKTNDQICTDKYGSSSQWDGTKTSDGRLNCGCISGYQWSSGRTSCVVNPKPVALPVISLPDNNQLCIRDYGVNSVWIGELNSSGGPVCRCQFDYEFNANRTACVAISIPAPQPRTVIEIEKKEMPKPAITEKPMASSTGEIIQPNINLAAASSAPIIQVQPKSLWSRIKSWFGFLKKDTENDCSKEVDKWLDYNLGLWIGMNADRSGSPELETELQAYRDEATERKQECY